MSECIFCQIASKSIPADMVYESEDVVAFLDRHPVSPLHVLVIPRIHRETILDLSDEEWRGIHGAINTIAHEQGVAETGFRLVNNCGVDGGQTVAHVHFHLLGKRSHHWPPG
ncbi:MAG: HIT domain-containing protein [Candidatus Margulisiibacteriota bacterium]